MKKIKLYKSLIFVFLTIIVGVFTSCKTSKIDQSEARSKDMAILDSLYAQDAYKIAIEVVYPFNTAATTEVANILLRNTGDNASRIDVRGEGNFIEIQNDSVKGYLPFFGERRLSAGAYGGTDLAVQIEEPVKNLSKQINSKKRKLKLEFTANQKGVDNERYEITIEIYPNKHATVNISPVYRTFIRYDGRLEEFDEIE